MEKTKNLIFLRNIGFEITFSRKCFSRGTERIWTYIPVTPAASKWSLVSANNSIIYVGQPSDELDLQTYGKDKEKK